MNILLNNNNTIFNKLQGFLNKITILIMITIKIYIFNKRSKYVYKTINKKIKRNIV